MNINLRNSLLKKAAPAKITPEFENRILELLKSKLKGYKTTHAIGGGLLGSGLGGTAGLIDTERRRRNGEMDNMSTEDKVKAYLIGALKPGLAGGAIGAGLGTGVGHLRRSNAAKAMYSKGKSLDIPGQSKITLPSMKEHLTDSLKNFNHDSPYVPELEKSVLDRLQGSVPEQNYMQNVKDKIFGEKKAGLGIAYNIGLV